LWWEEGTKVGEVLFQAEGGIVDQSPERSDVKDSQGRIAPAGWWTGRQKFAEQRHQGGERFASAGGSTDEHVIALGDRRPCEALNDGRHGEALPKPGRHERSNDLQGCAGRQRDIEKVQ
jgi:hypothetical protein